MAKDVTFILKAKDEASSVVDKFRHNAVQSVDGVSAALTTVGKGFTGFIGAWGALGAAVAGGAAFKEIVSETIAWAGESVKLSKALGITTQSASVLNVALGDVYLTHEDMLAANSRLTKTLGNNEDAFKKLGVATRDQDKNYRSSVDIMADVNAKLLQIKAGTDRNIAGTSIYGKGWQEVSSILKLTPAVMEEARIKAEKLHLIVGPEGVEKMKKYKAMMNDIEDVHKSMVVQMGNELLPILTQIGVQIGEIGVAASPVIAQWLQFLSHPIDFTASQAKLFGQSAEEKSFDAFVKNRKEKGHMSVAEHEQELAERFKKDEEANKAEIALMDKKLAVQKAHGDQVTALLKSEADFKLTTLKSGYEQGLSATETYYAEELKITLSAAQRKIDAARSYLEEEKKVLEATRSKMGKDSPEYQTALLQHEKALGDVQSAQLEYRKTVLDLQSKSVEALRKENAGYDEQANKLLESEGRYVEAEYAKQAASRKSIEYLRMEAAVVLGNSSARAALFATWKQESADLVTAKDKEIDSLKDYEKAMKSINDETMKLLGTYVEETAEAKMLREEKERLEPLERRLTLAKINGGAIAVDRLNKEIEAVKELNALKQAELVAEQRIAAFKQSLIDASRVNSGEVVGWNGNTPILANGGTAFVNGVSAGSESGIGLYSSPQKKYDATDWRADPFFNKSAFYANGTNYVPNDGFAYLHEGEAVIPKNINEAIGTPKQASDGSWWVGGQQIILDENGYFHNAEGYGKVMRNSLSVLPWDYNSRLTDQQLIAGKSSSEMQGASRRLQEIAAQGSGNVSVTFGDIQITVNGGGNATEIGREVTRQLYTQFQTMNRRLRMA